MRFGSASIHSLREAAADGVGHQGLELGPGKLGKARLLAAKLGLLAPSSAWRAPSSDCLRPSSPMRAPSAPASRGRASASWRPSRACCSPRMARGLGPGQAEAARSFGATWASKSTARTSMLQPHDTCE